MYTLFIDTHDELITISFIKDNDIFTKTKNSESHSTVLVPLIQEMLKEKNINLTNFNKIIVVNGPGSFTGIRIGLTVAKTISYCLKIPIYLISSLKSYLVSSNIKNKAISIIEDSKGYYVGYDDKEEYVISLDKFNDYKIVNSQLNIENIVKYCETISPVNVHGIKANYVKIIEALK